jgi:hypothetical protein
VERTAAGSVAPKRSTAWAKSTMLGRRGGDHARGASPESSLSLTTTDLDLTRAVCASLLAAFARARPVEAPYRHWTVTEVFPPDLAAELRGLPFARPDLHGVSGKRELHNDQRHYFDAANNARFAACAAVADAFQSREVTDAIEAATGADLAGSYVRLEYAQDTDGFWLQPHTDLGVKRFTMLIYLAGGEDQADLGTDIYESPGAWAKRSAFIDNTALVFVPGADTWHGLEPRTIAGVRRSVIMNYVTDAWRERGQLAYPDTPVRI